jgi:ABC-type phosphate/phosphonate transport system substrate-binding protein
MHTDGEGGSILASAAIKQFVSVADDDYEPIRHMARIANQTASWVSPEQLATMHG